MVHVFCPFLSHWLSSCLITISYQGSRVPCLLWALTRQHNKITHCHKNLRQENTNTLGETSATKLGEYWSTVKILLTRLSHTVSVWWMKWLLLLKMLYVWLHVRINLKETADLVNLNSLADRWLQHRETCGGKTVTIPNAAYGFNIMQFPILVQSIGYFVCF